MVNCDTRIGSSTRTAHNTEARHMMGFPKIPSQQEIEAMVTEGMAPMMGLLTEIRDLLQEQNQLTREQLAIQTSTLTTKGKR